MNICRAVPVVRSTNMLASRSFYVDYLGFEVGIDEGDFLMLRSPSAPTTQLIVAGDNAKDREVHRIDISLEVADVDAAREDARRQGLDVVYPLADEGWGTRRFFVHDPDGTVINVAGHRPEPVVVVASDDWQRRADEVWASLDHLPEDEFLDRIDRLVRDLPEGSGLAAFERACALDSTGHSDYAVPLYRQALDAGLDAPRRRRATIQMSSSLRNLGRTEESLSLLRAERTAASDELDDAVDAFMALALVDVGQEREALSLALQALARHLPRYQRSLANYARELH